MWSSAVFVTMLWCSWASVSAGMAGETATKKSDRYLAHIFNKYGSQGAINFEGLEHLLHSLKLGGLEFSPSHTVDEHRPKNFKMPDIVIEELNNTSTFSSIPFNGTVAANATNNDPVTNSTQRAPASDTTTLDDMWNEELWMNVDFKEMHDPKHRHPRHHDHNFNACLTPSAILRLALQQSQSSSSPSTSSHNIRAGSNRQRRHSSDDHHDDDAYDHADDESEEDLLSSVKITPSMFLNVCPALLVQLDQRSCSSVRAVPMKESAIWNWNAWLYASVSILIISMCGLAGVAVVPLVKSDAYQDVLRFLVALAVGTLCGDALMHLLPHALTPHSHDDDTPAETLFANGDVKFEPVWLCFCAFMSALCMFTLETMLPFLGQGSHGHGHSHQPARSNDVDLSKVTACPPTEQNNMLDVPLAIKRSRLSPVAFMVILGDGLHNITDGLAIGAAFAVDPVTGMATALAVLCHELPHELGDFALLLQTGVSIRKAIGFNIVSSVLSVLGMVVGLAIAGVNVTMVRWIYAGTSGTFLYIAMADLVPEMRRESDKIRNVLVQVVGIFAGGVLMLVIAMYEEKLRMLFE